MYIFFGTESVPETPADESISGRHLASAECISMITAFIHLIDVEILPGGDTLKPDMTRIGMGVLNPKGKLNVRLSRRIPS